MYLILCVSKNNIYSLFKFILVESLVEIYKGNYSNLHVFIMTMIASCSKEVKHQLHHYKCNATAHIKRNKSCRAVVDWLNHTQISNAPRSTPSVQCQQSVEQSNLSIMGFAIAITAVNLTHLWLVVITRDRDVVLGDLCRAVLMWIVIKEFFVVFNRGELFILVEQFFETSVKGPFINHMDIYFENCRPPLPLMWAIVHAEKIITKAIAEPLFHCLRILNDKYLYFSLR